MRAYKKKKTGKARRFLPLAIGIAFALGATILAVTVFAQKEKDRGGTAAHGSPDREDGTVTYQGKTYRYNGHLSNFLFIGVDTKEEMEEQAVSGSGGQADALYLLAWDRAEGEITVIAIPRDTVTDIEAYDLHGNSLGTTRDHISLSYAYGDGKHKSCALTREAVSGLFYGIPIEGYCALNIDAIPILADSVGGVAVTVPDDSLSGKDPQFTAGAEVTLTGENAETFVRWRDTGESQSAVTRMNRQKVFLEAYGRRLRACYAEDPSVVGTLLAGVELYMVTSIGNDVCLKLADSYLASGKAASYTVPGEGAAGADGFDEYRVDEDALYGMVLEIFYEETEE